MARAVLELLSSLSFVGCFSLQAVSDFEVEQHAYSSCMRE